MNRTHHVERGLRVDELLRQIWQCWPHDRLLNDSCGFRMLTEVSGGAGGVGTNPRVGVCSYPVTSDFLSLSPPQVSHMGSGFSKEVSCRSSTVC
jgi:hypothetical protein